MNPFKSLAEARKEHEASRLFPVTHLNSPTVFETKNMAIGSVIALEGVPFITELNETLNHNARQLHQALLSLGEGFMAMVTLHRKKQRLDLEGEFQSPFAERLNARYHQRFKGQNVYHNHWYLTILHKGQTASGKWFNTLMGKPLSDLSAMAREQKTSQLKQVVEQLLMNLSRFKPRLLGVRDNQAGHSELLSFLSLIPNAGESLPFRRASCHRASGKGFKDALTQKGLYPDGHCGQYLCNHRLFFGTHIQFEQASTRRFGVMLSIKKYPQETGSLVLDPLLEVDCELISTHSFTPLASQKALNRIRVKRDKLESANDKAQSQQDALSVLEDDLASERASLGFHHNTVMALGESTEALSKAIQEITSAYGHCGVGVVRETLGAEPAFWAQIPGNGHFITRAALITSENFSDFCSLHNYQTGFCNGNHLGQAVTLLETPSKTPVYFNYHTKGSKTNPAKGHTLIFGSNDAGKTSLVSFLDAQMGRYHGRSFFLDRDEASKIYILASGNSSYCVISPRNKHNIQMNPLQLPDKPENRTFLKTWLSHLLLKKDETDLPSAIKEWINECIDYCYEQLEPRYRTLSHISRLFPVNFERWPELRRWLKGGDTVNEGEFHWLFDNATDALELGFDKVGFDLTYLMDEVSAQIATPVYLYLVHRMRQCLDGRLTTIVMDEFWQILSTPFWVRYLKNWLPTIRKLNGHFVFATQSPQSVVESPVLSTLMDNAATCIYFPNPQASQALYLNHLNLTLAEYQTIRNNTPESRLFLYKQGRESMVCRLDLSALSDELRVLSGNKNTVRLLNRLMAERGEKPEQWLEEFLLRSAP